MGTYQFVSGRFFGFWGIVAGFEQKRSFIFKTINTRML